MSEAMALARRGAAALLREAPRPRFVREARNAAWLAVGTVCVGAFIGQLDTSIVTLAFPTLERQFHVTLAAAQWVSLVYLLVLTGMLPVVGRIADARGRKMLYIWGAAVFTAASLACGFAPSLGLLIAFRGVQAVGAALLQANSVAIVVRSVPREKARTALGVQAAAQALGLALGPFVGGLIIANFSWPWIFWVKIPIGIALVVAGHYLLPRTQERTPLRRFDFAGTALLFAGLAALLLALSAAAGKVSSSGVPLLVGVAAVSLIGFGLWELRCADPLVDLRLIRPAVISLGLVGAACAYLLLFGPLALFPQLLSQGTVVVGLVLTALPLGFAAGALRGDLLVPRRWGTAARCVLGAAVALCALPLLALDPLSITWVVAWLAVLGFGLGLFIPANNAAVMTAVPANHSATMGGLVNVSRSLGTAFGVAMVTLCVHIGASSSTLATGRIALAVLTPVAVIAGATALLTRAKARRTMSAVPSPETEA